MLITVGGELALDLLGLGLYGFWLHSDKQLLTDYNLNAVLYFAMSGLNSSKLEPKKGRGKKKKIQNVKCVFVAKVMVVTGQTIFFS